ncbi:MAG: uracil-DNA glycosylase [Candidatus Yanofskybacteria bacterium]|nr:uracil-DNA glycosylase [Candidatus Yanofskybacteria bacterium]
MTKEQKLQYIFGAIKKAYPNRKLVFNDGSPDMPVMIIGEAPGKDEEIQGKPFVGRGGKLLNSTLETLGWKRSDFYVTNVVKYRPSDEFGGNRTPTPEEIEKFRLALEKEIEAINPKLIVILGKVAMSGLGIEGSMGANRGQVIERNGRKIIVTYHPAAILRNPNWEPQFCEDLAKIKELI